MGPNVLANNTKTVLHVKTSILLKLYAVQNTTSDEGVIDVHLLVKSCEALEECESNFQDSEYALDILSHRRHQLAKSHAQHAS